MMENNYPSHGYYYHIDSYKTPEDENDWMNCPRCNLKPKINVFDNGEYTRCGCYNNKYDGFTITCDETIGDCVRRTGGFAEYNNESLKNNWNKYCKEQLKNEKH